MKMCLVMILVMKVFIFSKTMIICLLCPLLCGLFFFWKGAKGELSYKVKKHPQSIPALWMSCGHLDSFLSFFRCLADIRLLRFFVFRFFQCFQCDTDTVASQLIIRIRHFNVDCLIARLCRRKDGGTSSGKRI